MPRVGGYVTRTRIVSRTMMLLQERSYHSLGLDEIIRYCGASKGAFYFHFRSKIELAEAVIEMYSNTIPPTISACFAGRDWKDGVETWLKVFIGARKGTRAFGAALTRVSHQLMQGNHSFALAVRLSIKSTESALRNILMARGLSYEVADRKSATWSALIEGHTLRFLVAGRPACVDDLRRDMRALKDAQLKFLPAELVPGAPFQGADMEESRLLEQQKKSEIPIDIVDEQSTIISGNRRREAGARRREIVNAAAEVFWRHGYSATSLKELSRASGVPKGSMHAYLGAKRGLALAVLERYERSSERLLERAFESGTWRGAIEALYKALKAGGLVGHVLGCPVGNMGLEFVNTDAELAARAAALLEKTEMRFAQAVAKYGRSGASARPLAATAVALTEGHMARMVMYSDLDPVEEWREDMIALLSA